MNKTKIQVAGWPLRKFSAEETERYLEDFQPHLFEVSKDQVTKNASIKSLYKLLRKYRSERELEVSYAGTTDFVECSELSFSEYKEYLKIQAAHANFIEADFFRVLVGGEKDTEAEVLKRLSVFDEFLGDTNAVIEFHGGWESNPENIERIVEETEFQFVIDFQNLLYSGLRFEDLESILPVDRIAYFHTRNLPNIYIEDESALEERKKWQQIMEEKPVLWEPKELQKQSVKEEIGWT